jgi:hypothetical protein
VSPDASATDRRCGVRIRRDRMLRVSTRDPVAGLRAVRDGDVVARLVRGIAESVAVPLG